MSIPQQMLKDDSSHGPFKIKYTSKREAVLIFHLKYLFCDSLFHYISWNEHGQDPINTVEHNTNQTKL